MYRAHVADGLALVQHQLDHQLLAWLQYCIVCRATRQPQAALTCVPFTCRRLLDISLLPRASAATTQPGQGLPPSRPARKALPPTVKAAANPQLGGGLVLPQPPTKPRQAAATKAKLQSFTGQAPVPSSLRPPRTAAKATPAPPPLARTDRKMQPFSARQAPPPPTASQKQRQRPLPPVIVLPKASTAYGMVADQATAATATAFLYTGSGLAYNGQPMVAAALGQPLLLSNSSIGATPQEQLVFRTVPLTAGPPNNGRALLACPSRHMYVCGVHLFSGRKHSKASCSSSPDASLLLGYVRAHTCLHVTAANSGIDFAQSPALWKHYLHG